MRNLKRMKSLRRNRRRRLNRASAKKGNGKYRKVNGRT